MLIIKPIFIKRYQVSGTVLGVDHHNNYRPGKALSDIDSFGVRC